MRLLIALSGLLLAALSGTPAFAGDGRTYRVYFLGGQSNMEGFGYTAELPPEWSGEQEAIRIFNGHNVPDGEDGGGVGLWMPLQPGYGVGARSDGTSNQLSDRFGPELAFGARIAELNPGENIALVKYARSGSSLALGASHFGTWAPEFSEANGRNQYDNALTAIETAFSAADIDGDGHADRLIPAGIIWMQGESDAYTRKPALVYEQNLRRMMELLRAALRVDDLPVVIGRITDSGMDEDGLRMDHIALVQRAQAAYVAADACAAYVSEIDDYQHADDGWHYVSTDYIRMGRAFAEAVHALAGTCR